jgi:radical SAM superfamily enzyme YgiQ (UPF0313 family)
LHICFITAPTETERSLEEFRSGFVHQFDSKPPLGILSLGAELQNRGDKVQVIDLNRLYFGYLEHPGFISHDFVVEAAAVIAAVDAPIYGFGSVCSSFPISIAIARELRSLRPGATILFGGPQASVVDTRLLSAFPFVDMVLRGEAEGTLPILLDTLAGPQRLEQVPGLTYRAGSRVRRNSNAPLVQDLDALPTPAFDLMGGLDGRTIAPLELGRGCPFACTFCSTNDFFRRKFRLRSPARVLQDMQLVAHLYSIRNFELTHDMFTVDRAKVAEFCEFMAASGEKFTWSCSARTDGVDQDLLSLMARSGCTGIFYGIEVGSERMQKIIDKGLDVQRAQEVVSATERLGMSSIVSLITGFPEETREDLKDTTSVFMHSLRCPQSKPQLMLLAPLAETPIHSKYKDQLSLQDLYSDMSHQSLGLQNLDVQMIREYPEIFPNFYAAPTPNLDWAELGEFREFITTTATHLRWLILAIHDCTSGIADYFLNWRAHRMRMFPGLAGRDLRRYYRTPEFLVDFLFFARNSDASEHAAVHGLLSFEDAVRASGAESAPCVASGAAKLIPLNEDLEWRDIPIRSERTIVFDLPFDLQHLIECLQTKTKFVARGGLHSYATMHESKLTERFVELSDWVAGILHACDGQQNLETIVKRLSFGLPNETARRYIFWRLLQDLWAQDFVEIYRIAEGPTSRGRSAEVAAQYLVRDTASS